jgi:MTH538 TIR-like domain (DUF1863)
MADADSPTEPAYLYDAFISYRHVERDSKWAKWLIDALERYRVPKELQERGRPPRLRKIFRDEDEVPASGDLNDQIRQALIASRFLIVVCSPYTPRSIWVQREIEIFNELGRGDQVLALLTEGEPGDSFPNPMLERQRQVTDPDGTVRIVKEAKEPLAADVRPRRDTSMRHLRWTALLRLVAVILGVKYDDLYHRERQRERARQLRWAAAAAVVLSAAGTGLFAYLNMERPKIAYYRDVVSRWEIPEGINPINDQTRTRLNASYRVTTLHGKVVEMRYQNSAGSLVNDPSSGSGRWLAHYRNDGSLESADFFDETNRLTYEQLYQRDPTTNRYVINLKRGTSPIALDAVVNSITQNYSIGSFKGNTEVTRYELTFDENGFVSESRNQDYFGVPIQNAQGSFGHSFQYSPSGLLTRTAEIGPDGSEITLKDTPHATTNSYDRDNRKIRTTTVGPDNKLINRSGYAVEAAEYGSDGNLALVRYFDASGKPARRDGACAQDRFTYDEYGHLAELSCLGVDSAPVLSKNGYAKVVRRYDDRGYPVESAFFGIAGEPRSGPEGCVKLARALDPNGHITQVECYGSDGNLAVRKTGSARTKSSFDGRGNLTELSFFAADGRPVRAAPNYCARITFEFDARDTPSAWNCFGEDGKLALNSQGIARFTYGYDPTGNRIAEDYFGEDGKPILVGSCQCAHSRRTYDRNGNTAEIRFSGIDGEPVNGIERTVFRYDEQGNETEFSHLGADGKLVLNQDGYAKIAAIYDSRADMTRATYLGTDNTPILSRLGYAGTSYAYDSRGKESERSFFHVDGKPIMTAFGDAGYTSLYDTSGNLIEQASFDANRKPALNANGFSIIRTTFDDRNREIEVVYLNTDAKLVISRNGYAGYRQSFDDRDEPSEKTYFGVDHKPMAVSGVARERLARDAAGNLSERATFDVDGKPTPFALGVARITFAYDDWNQETEARYFDKAGQELPIEVFIARVLPGAVAAQNNLSAGDRIISYGGRKMTSSKQMITATTDPRLGVRRRLDVIRGTQNLTFDVPAGQLGIMVDHIPVKP